MQCLTGSRKGPTDKKIKKIILIFGAGTAGDIQLHGNHVKSQMYTGLSASILVLQPFTCPVRIYTAVNVVSTSYLRFEGTFTSPVVISISTSLVISIPGLSGHLPETTSGTPLNMRNN